MTALIPPGMSLGFERFYSDSLAAIVGDPPLNLHHYTSPGGVVGILQSGQLFASNAFFTNDVKEIRLSMATLRDAAQSRVDAWPPGATKLALQLFAQQMNAALARTAGIFVACFSTEGDDNAQWSAYGGIAGGYNLTFDWRELQAVALRRGLQLVPCVYSAELQGKYVSAAVAAFENLVGTATQGMTAGDAAKAVKEAVELFVRKASEFAPILKDAGFKHECEWRLVQFTNDVDRMEFEPRETVIRPRVRIDLSDDGKKTMPALRQVTVGPTPHLDIAPDAVRSLLSSVGYPPDLDGEPALPVVLSRSTLRVV